MAFSFFILKKYLELRFQNIEYFKTFNQTLPYGLLVRQSKGIHN